MVILIYTDHVLVDKYITFVFLGLVDHFMRGYYFGIFRIWYV